MTIKDDVLKEMRTDDGRVHTAITLTTKKICEEIEERIENYKSLSKRFLKNEDFLAKWEAMVELLLEIKGNDKSKSYRKGKEAIKSLRSRN